jgi:D-proline reductase (dithiol) PrdB
MVRMTDLPTTTQASMANLETPEFLDRPFVSGPPLKSRRIAVVTSAGLVRRGEHPFMSGDTDFRVIPADTSPADILMSHVSVNFDRTGFQRDLNVVLPIDRLRELLEEGLIGSVADNHYSFMGATDPRGMQEHARTVAGRLKNDQVDGVLLTPV